MNLSIKSIVMWTIEIYILLSVIFGRTTTGQARYPLLATILFIFVISVYIVLRKKLEINWYTKTLFLFGIILTISSFYSPTIDSILETYINRYWMSFLIVLLISNVIKNIDDIHILLTTCIIAGAGYAIYIYSYYGINFLINSSTRIDNNLGNQNEIGMYCAFSIAFAIYELFIKWNKKLRALYIACASICVPALLFTGSRKAILIAIIAVIILLLCYSMESGKFKRVIFMAFIAVVIIVYISQEISYFSSVTNRFSELFEFATGSGTNKSDASRVYYITQGWKLFLDSPVWGNGFLSSYYYFGLYSHNNFIELLMDNGLIGFIVFYYIHFRLAKDAIKNRKNKQETYAFIIMTIASMVMVDIGVVSFYNSYILILLLLASKMIFIDKSQLEKAVNS